MHMCVHSSSLVYRTLVVMQLNLISILSLCPLVILTSVPTDHVGIRITENDSMQNYIYGCMSYAYILVVIYA